MNTSRYLLKTVTDQHQPDVIALQEVWKLPDDFKIPGYTCKSEKLRDEKTGGGVAIFCKEGAKTVDLKEFQCDGLEATWCDIMIKGKRTVVGSVYINVGKIKEIDVLDQVIEKVLKIHRNLIVCMDATLRNQIWDPSSLKLKPSSTVRKMGNRMSQLVLGNSMEILNNCEITYESGEHATAVDITITKGINAYGEVKWKTIPDELQTPHKGIIVDVGPSKKDKKRESY